MKKPLLATFRTVLEGTIDDAIGRKEHLRTEAQNCLAHIQAEQTVEASTLVPLVQAILDIQRAQDSIAADRYNLSQFQRLQ